MSEEQQTALEELRGDATSRKRFLKMAGGGAVATAFAAFAAACGDDDKSSGGSSGASTQSKKSSGGTSSDLDIVNYALTLEYLESDFYNQVIESGVIKDKKVASLAKSFGENEAEHVAALMKTAKMLGTPAEKPKTDFSAVLDGGPKKILQTAADVENLGAAAYLGQAAKIKSKEILAAALSIHSVEARHAAALNELVGRGFKGSIPDGAFAKPMSMDQVLKQVQPFLGGQS